MRSGLRCRQLARIIVALGGIALLSGCHTSAGGDRSPRGIVMSLVEQADSLEIYSVTWPEDRREEHRLEVVSAASTPERWAELLDAVANAGPRTTQHGGLPEAYIRLRAGEAVVAEGWTFPPTGEFGLYLPDGGRVALEGAALGEFFHSYHERLLTGHRNSRADELAAADAQPDASLVQRLPDFDEVKQRISLLFRSTVYVNIHAPGENSMGVDVTKQAPVDWETMTRAVEEATEGWAIIGSPDVFIMCEPRDHPERLIVLNYVAGVLGCDDPALGGNIVVLRPASPFGDALDSMLARARSRERNTAQ